MNMIDKKIQRLSPQELQYIRNLISMNIKSIEMDLVAKQKLLRKFYGKDTK